MLFNSYAFIFLYLPVVLIGYFYLARKSQTQGVWWLALASLFFYAYWSYSYTFLLIASIIFNFSIGSSIAYFSDKNKKKSLRLLQIAIVINISLLGYYKYANFFIDTLNILVGSEFKSFEYLLPLGISFFTFTQIAYLIDAYRGNAKEYSFSKYLLFVTYFPHLIAGPVLHHKQMMPQFSNTVLRNVNWENIANGLIIFAIGLSKKIFLADALAPYADAVFGASSRGVELTTYEAWAGALAYTFQLYYDFSGYSDMAIGISLMFNIHLPINFNQPYKATSIIDFWRRWHITLSQFLRDYLYIPLGGNKNGSLKRYLNLLITMLLGGLWHGAGWTFIVWGGMHGVYLAINHLWRSIFKLDNVTQTKNKLGIVFGWLLTFLSVIVAWVVFRAESLSSAHNILMSMFGIESRPISFKEVINGNFLLVANNGKSCANLLLLAIIGVWGYPFIERVRIVILNIKIALLQSIILAAVFILIINKFGSYSPFLYFQF
jgi:alginate O-acetyltransferase complex protein AlgI